MRGKLLLILLLGAPLTGCHRSLKLLSSSTNLPADGRDHLVAVVSPRVEDVRLHGIPVSGFRAEADVNDQLDIFIRSPVMPGTARIELGAGKNRITLPLTFVPDTTDAPFADGTPDWMRLHTEEDRLAFRHWFTELAERAADTPDAKLPPEITDCASLLRYAYREALYAHDDKWYAQFPADASSFNAMPATRSVRQWSYPNTPLGAALFRVRPGPFAPDDLANGAFAQFADAKTLHADNTFLLGRSLRLAKPGDIIFYRLLETDSQYHSMIITGEQGEWVVYHTGSIDGHRGEMRRVLLSDLLHHPDPRWRPEPANPNFLGVYRWNILREQ